MLQFSRISKGHLVELQRLPQLEEVAVWSPQGGDIGVESLSALPRLKVLTFHDSYRTNELLAHLPELPHLEGLTLFNCKGFTDEDFASLQRLPNLKSLDLAKSGPVNDEGLLRLSRLQNLETLCLRMSSGKITDTGLQALAKLSNLKELIVIRGDFTAEQLALLKQLVPNAVITVN